MSLYYGINVIFLIVSTHIEMLLNSFRPSRIFFALTSPIPSTSSNSLIVARQTPCKVLNRLIKFSMISGGTREILLVIRYPLGVTLSSKLVCPGYPSNLTKSLSSRSCVFASSCNFSKFDDGLVFFLIVIFN